MNKCFILLLPLAMFLAACKPAATVRPRPPQTPVVTQLEPGIQLTTLTVERAGTQMMVWLYLPTPAPAAQLPCVLIAPAGSRLFHGMPLEEGDRAEHLPYVRAGFAVVAFEVDGPLPSDNPTNREAAAAIDAFRAARGGIDNAIAAFDYAASRPEIDEKRIYIAGHSSAATLALQAAEYEPRLVGCVAYAPACDVRTRLAGSTIDRVRAGTLEFAAGISPDRSPQTLNCPTMLFTARDDDNVRSDTVLAFAALLRRTNHNVRMTTVNSGGHYDAMIRQGIPAGIQFLQSLSGGKRP